MSRHRFNKRFKIQNLPEVSSPYHPSRLAVQRLPSPFPQQHCQSEHEDRRKHRQRHPQSYNCECKAIVPAQVSFVPPVVSVGGLQSSHADFKADPACAAPPTQP
eukprot:m.325004 g.325004  ORF g.325004 m.325004 type:complete len:104 (+) comp16469_c0_seq2:725-1036(+)